jgi:hypothetical protein
MANNTRRGPLGVERSTKFADKHYLRVTAADLARALRGQHSAQQQSTATGESDGNKWKPNRENPQDVENS